MGENQPAPVEDPRRLEQVILHLVTNLPSPPLKGKVEDPFSITSPENSASPTHRLTIIPPNKERIVCAIEKMYSVIKHFQRVPDHEENRVEDNSDDGSVNQLELPAIGDAEIGDAEIGNAEIGDAEIFNTNQEQQINPFVNLDDIINYVEAPETPHPHMFTFEEAESEYNTASGYNTVTSPDMGYFDASPSAFSNISSMFANLNQNNEESLYEQRAHLDEIPLDMSDLARKVPIACYAEEANKIQYLPQPITIYNCGTKRPNEFEDLDMVFKKKITNVVQEHEQMEYSEDAPYIDELVDESEYLRLLMALVLLF